MTRSNINFIDDPDVEFFLAARSGSGPWDMYMIFTPDTMLVSDMIHILVKWGVCH